MKIIIENFLSDSLGSCTNGCADEFIQSVKKMTSDNDENNYMYWYPPTTNQASQVVRSGCKQYGGNVNIIVAVEEDPFNFTSEIKNWHSSFSAFFLLDLHVPVPVPVDLHVADLLASERTCVVYMYRRPLGLFSS